MPDSETPEGSAADLEVSGTEKSDGRSPQLQSVVAEGALQSPTLDSLIVSELALSRRKILIVDDELIGPTRAQLTPEVIEALADTTSEEYASLVAVSKLIPGFVEIEAGGRAQVKEYYSGEELVHVLSSDAFKTTASPKLKDLVRKFSADVRHARELRIQIEQAFDEKNFELFFLGSVRPTPEEVLEAALLIVDLVLPPANEPVDAAINFLGNLASKAGSRILPPIILFSNSEDLDKNKLQFSSRSGISAAGLLILRKQELLKPEFASAGLQLTFRQLELQRQVAHEMRSFMGAWMTALENARKKAEDTLWNLDAPAMQMIHQTAFSDSDPYDEHLNELIVREYLWHVESDPVVGDAIRSLDAEFQKSFDGSMPPKLIRRFTSPFVDPAHVRALLGRFTWTGWGSPGPFLGADRRDLNKLVPFGAIFVPQDCSDGKDCYIHVTQQCDLNAISRQKEDTRSFVFVAVKAVQIFSDKVRHYATEDLVARGLQIGGKEFDFVFQPGRMLAMTLAQLAAFTEEAGLSIRGRLRHDIATQFLQAAANNMTRPASQKVSRAAVGSAKVTIHSEKFGAKKYLAFPDESLTVSVEVGGGGAAGRAAASTRPKAKVVEVMAEEKGVSFPNDACFQIALWIKRVLESVAPHTTIDPGQLCDSLLIGLVDEVFVISNLQVMIREVKLDTAYKQIGQVTANGERIQLTIFVEKETGEISGADDVMQSSVQEMAATSGALPRAG